MKVLVIGSGGREHALCWRIKQSPAVSEVWCVPGNPGTALIAKGAPIAVDDVEGLLALAKREHFDLTVVGPEVSLSAGVVDAFVAAGLKIFGPTQAAAQLETSKSFSKEVMSSAKVPTARCVVVTTLVEAENYIASHGAPIVIKADGLAAGKGVVVAMNLEEARRGVEMVFNELHSNKVVLEDFLEGVEVSFIVATDGERIIPCSSSHDYKRIYDNDEGPNTGGMGTVSPTPRFTESQAAWAVEHIIRPMLVEMARRGIPFNGFLYAGLMVSPKGDINVVEFNARMGDPECQSIMRRAEFDFTEFLFALVTGAALPEIRWAQKSAVTVVLAAEGYPAKVVKGAPISGIDSAEKIPGCVVFHAGTSMDSKGSLVVSGGRVLNVTGIGESLDAARRCAYEGAERITFKGHQIRRDIGIR